MPSATTRCSAAEELERRISARTSGRIRALKVEDQGNLIVLSGQTNTYYVKQIATQLAVDAFPETELRNSIEVI